MVGKIIEWLDNIHGVRTKIGNKQSNCAKNLLDNDHSVVRIEDIFSVLCVTKKKGHTNTLTARPFEVEEKKKNWN